MSGVVQSILRDVPNTEHYTWIRTNPDIDNVRIPVPTATGLGAVDITLDRTVPGARYGICDMLQIVAWAPAG